MTQFVRELPGDVLADLAEKHEYRHTTEFTRAHERRVTSRIEASPGTKQRTALEAKWDDLALSYDQWWNRFEIKWGTDPGKWRALFTNDNLETLVFAEWCEKGDEFYQRMRKAIRLQNALKLEQTDYEDLENTYEFNTNIDHIKVRDTLSWVLVDVLRESAVARDCSFEVLADIVSRYSRNAMTALADLGICRDVGTGDHWLDHEDTSRFAHPHRSHESKEDPDSRLLQLIYDWARVMLEEEFREIE